MDSDKEDINEEQKKEDDYAEGGIFFVVLPVIVIVLVCSAVLLAVVLDTNSSSGENSGSSSSDGEMTYEKLERKALGTYETYDGGKLILRDGGECYIHLQDPGNRCEYDFYIPATGEPEIDIDLISSDLPGTGGGFEGVVRNGEVVLSVFGDSYEYEKIR